MDMRLRRSTALLLTGALGLGLGGASLAWACGGQATISLSASSGTAGSPLGISGALFTADAPITIHWGGTSGVVVATATGPSFSVNAAVPAGAAPGVHYVVATTGAFQASRAFRVVAPQAAASSPTAGSEPASGSTSDLPVSAAPPAVAPSAEPALAPVPATGATAPAPAARPARPVAAPAPARDAARATPAAAPAAPAPVAPAPNPVAEEPAAPAPAAAPAPSPVAPIEPSTATASADLWSGFRSGPSAARGMFEAPAADGPSGPALALGIAFLVVGAGLLSGGVVLVVASRRRAQAEA
jgi:hypothetical protein